jgi:integrase
MSSSAGSEDRVGKQRQSQGSAKQRGGCWYAIVTLERGKRHGKRKWVPIPLEPGETLTDEEARAIAAHMQSEFDAGRDPTVKSAEMPEVVDGLVPAFCDAWAGLQSYDSAPKDRATMARYLPTSPLAKMKVSTLRPRHIVAFIRWLKAHPSERGGTLAPRTVRNVADAVRRALNSAVIDELLVANPFDPVRGELPEITDKDPLARETWEYQWDEIATLVWDESIPADRRMLNALRFGTGGRISELAVTRWRDWERNVEPLSRLNIRRARKSVSRKEGSTKTGAVKRVPLVSTLAAALADWHDFGWELHYGRKPTPDDFIVPTAGRLDDELLPRNENKANAQFKADCERVKVRVLSQHKARHSWVSRIQDDGADGAIVRWVTHAPPSTAFDGYTRAQWSRLCAEVAKLRFPSRPTTIATPADSVGVDAGVDIQAGETRKAACYSGLVVVGARGFEGPEDAANSDKQRDSTGCVTRCDDRSAPLGPLALTPSTPSGVWITAANALEFVAGWTAGEVLN